mmetsp:Transcript_27069/g.74424  ORF Transcript_27069/g.74424 Transcript_27069/m.74424 type:complete len:466 (+) Transcript_27069:443-1840(+)
MPCASSMPSATSFLCTMTSSPPPSGMMKPKAFSRNHIFTTPVRMPSPARSVVPMASPAAAIAPYTFLAIRLFLLGSQPSSKVTWAPTMSHWPSARSQRCTKMSSPPPSGTMKPMPRSSTQDFTTPVSTGAPLAPGSAWPETASAHFMAILLPLDGSQPSWNITWTPGARDWQFMRPLLCTKTSSPPASGRMKPMPRSSYQALITPPCMPVMSTGAGRACSGCTPPLPPQYAPASRPAAPLPSTDTAPVTFFAMRLAFSWSQPSSNITGEPTTSHWPSSRELRCTKASSPPVAGAMKPMPRSSFHVLTTPVRIWPMVLVGMPLTGGAATRLASSVPPPPPPPPPPLPAPLASAGAAPATFFATLLFLLKSQLSSKATGLPTTRQTPSMRSHLCTKASSPPSSGWIKPMPLSSIQALTVPVSMLPGTSGLLPCEGPSPGAGAAASIAPLARTLPRASGAAVQRLHGA